MTLLYSVAVVLISLIYFWTLYNLPIVVTGVRKLCSNKPRKKPLSTTKLPRMSIIVPAKNEEKVVGRLLKALMAADYPQNKKEIIIVEDGSTDRTAEICNEFREKYPNQVKILNRYVSDGKPSALTEAIKLVNGELVAVFDADNIPEPDSLLRAASYFEDPSVAAVQGRLIAVNEDENILTKFVAQEETLRCEAYMRGKTALGLFVPLTGSCYFVRKDVLDAVGGWDSKVLSEDMELAARLTHNGHKIKYASDVRSWQEYPATVVGFFKQRVRWFRGTMEVGVKYGKLVKNLNKVSLDAEVTLMGPFIFISCLIGYLISVMSIVIPLNADFFSLFLANMTSILSVVLLAAAGLAMVYGQKPRKIHNLLWVPFIFIYWSIQNFIASYALLLILLRRPKHWLKTEKHGTVANSTFELQDEQSDSVIFNEEIPCTTSK